MSTPLPPEDDGFHIDDVGEWSRDKHHFLRRYVDAFTTSMKGKKWGGLHYIDLFAGPGVVRPRDGKGLEWGSPLIAAQTQFPFTQLHLCEKRPKAHQSLQRRLSRFKLKSAPQVLLGDANKRVNEILAEIPHGTLSLAFLDPYGLHLHYETVRVLANRRVDLIIFFPDRSDMLRNWEKVYAPQPDSKLDRFMGPGADWRNALRNTSNDSRVDVLRRLYCSQLEKAHYTCFEFERISRKRHPLYQIIFAARHEFGGKLWRKVTAKKPDGQQMLDFGD